ncbi:hypothetical protein D3C78_1974110 [compost metagenome]
MLNTFESLNEQVKEFINGFNPVEFDKARKLFLADVIEENRNFNKLLEAFLRQ